MNGDKIFALVVGCIALIWALYYRIIYTVCEGECIDYRHAYKSGYRVQYRYKNPTPGREETFIGSGASMIRPTVGKTYKIFVNPKVAEKVVAYNYYVNLLVVGLILVLLTVGMSIFEIYLNSHY